MIIADRLSAQGAATGYLTGGVASDAVSPWINASLSCWESDARRGG